MMHRGYNLELKEVKPGTTKVISISKDELQVFPTDLYLDAHAESNDYPFLYIIKNGLRCYLRGDEDLVAADLNDVVIAAAITRRLAKLAVEYDWLYKLSDNVRIESDVFETNIKVKAGNVEIMRKLV